MASMDFNRLLAVEEQPFCEVVHDSPDLYEERLIEREAMEMTGRLQIHLAVKYGILDVVKRLLELGPDLGIRDESNATAVELAEEMTREHPEDRERREILEVLRSASKRDATKEKSSTSDDSVSSGHACIDLQPNGDQMLQKLVENVFKLSQEMASFNESLQELRREMTTLINDFSRHLDSSSGESSSQKDNVQSFKYTDVSLLGIQSEVSSLMKEIMSVAGVLDDVRKKMTSRDVTLEKVKSRYSATKRLLLSVGKAIEDVNKELSSRDTLLEKLEASVTSLAHEWRPLESPITVVTDVENVVAEGEEWRKSDAGMPQSVDMNAEVRTQCVEALMQNTVIFNENISKVSRIRGFYLKLCSFSPMTSSVLMFLQFQRKVQILIDFDSYNIARMKDKVRDFDGVERQGIDFKSFVDFNELKVYLGGKMDTKNKEENVMGSLSMSLARMSILLAFKNGGRPYAEGDHESRRQYRRMIDETEWRSRRGLNKFDHYVIWALKWRTRLGMERDMIAAVPGMIAHYGPKEGESRLRRQIPPLVNFYQNHVVTTLSKLPTNIDASQSGDGHNVDGSEIP